MSALYLLAEASRRADDALAGSPGCARAAADTRRSRATGLRCPVTVVPG